MTSFLQELPRHSGGRHVELSFASRQLPVIKLSNHTQPSDRLSFAVKEATALMVPLVIFHNRGTGDGHLLVGADDVTSSS